MNVLHQIEYVPKFWIKKFPITAPAANAAIIVEEISAACLSTSPRSIQCVTVLWIAERKFPIHIVVAIFVLSIIRNVSTCMPQAKEISEFANKFMDWGNHPTAKKTAASNKTHICRQWSHPDCLLICRVIVAQAIPIENAITGQAYCSAKRHSCCVTWTLSNKIFPVCALANTCPRNRYEYASISPPETANKVPIKRLSDICFFISSSPCPLYFLRLLRFGM